MQFTGADFFSRAVSWPNKDRSTTALAENKARWNQPPEQHRNRRRKIEHPHSDPLKCPLMYIRSTPYKPIGTDLRILLEWRRTATYSVYRKPIGPA